MCLGVAGCEWGSKESQEVWAIRETGQMCARSMWGVSWSLWPCLGVSVCVWCCLEGWLMMSEATWKGVWWCVGVSEWYQGMPEIEILAELLHLSGVTSQFNWLCGAQLYDFLWFWKRPPVKSLLPQKAVAEEMGVGITCPTFPRLLAKVERKAWKSWNWQQLTTEQDINRDFERKGNPIIYNLYWAYGNEPKMKRWC